MVEGGMKCVKYLLFAFNLIFVIAAIALIAVGVYVQVQLNDYLSFFSGKVNAAAILIIVVGAIILFIAGFGCCGAIKENYVCTMVFAVLLAVVFIFELAGGIAGFVMRNQLKTEVKDKMLEAEKNYESQEGVRKSWDAVQTKFKCCGVESYTEWTMKNGSLPNSCCKNTKVTCKKGSADFYSDPCLERFTEYVQHNIVKIGGVGLGLAFIQIVGIIFACCLARAIRKEYEVV